MADELSAADLQRFSRHLILPQVGVEGQAKLRTARIAVIGAGGLGSPVILYLAAAGVGHLTIIDDDVVDISNLQRQVLHDSKSVGISKVESAKNRIQALDPQISVQTYSQRLEASNALQILEGHDLVVDGTDNFPTRYLVNDACEILNIPWIYGSIHRFEGQVSVFNFKGGPNYRDIFPRPPPPGMVPSCSEAGVLGVLPGVIGCIQANEAIKVILGIGEILSGILLLYDALEMRFRGLKASHDPNRERITELLDIEGYCQVAEVEEQDDSGENSMINEIGPQETNQRMEEGWKPYVLDVRSLGEAAIASLSMVDDLIPHVEIISHLDNIPKDRDILLYCHHGGRSLMAGMILLNSGWERTKLFNLSGGIDQWSAQVDASIPRY